MEVGILLFISAFLLQTAFLSTYLKLDREKGKYKSTNPEILMEF